MDCVSRFGFSQKVITSILHALAANLAEAKLSLHLFDKVFVSNGYSLRPF